MILIIDSNYLGYVCKFSLSTGLTYRGNHTEVIFGFLKNIISLKNRFETRDIIFCWDSKESKRKELFKDYKGKRHANKTEEQQTGDALVFQQFDELRTKVLPSLGFNNVFYQKGYESDDIIASIVMKHKAPCIVVSSDTDLYQLLDYCSLFNFTKKDIMTKDLFIRQYGITPKQWIDVKSIAGCVSDNVPGVSGVGEKTTIKYLTGNLSSVSKTFDSIEKRNEKDSSFVRKLVELPFPGTLSPQIVKNDLSLEKYKTVCEKYGFNSLLTPEAISRWKEFNK